MSKQEGNATATFIALKEAYFLEAFALHYLTDLFATGHLRTPRRQLHQSNVNIFQPLDLSERFYPADAVAKLQHGEDNAMGLWVENKRGEAWPAYGDKQSYNAKSTKNLQQAMIAAQSGVDEIWTAYASPAAIQIDPNRFEALWRVGSNLS